MRRALIVVLSGAALAACVANLDGFTGGGEGPDASSEAGGGDAGSDAFVDAPVADANADADAASVDAGPACDASTIVDAPLTTDLTPFTPFRFGITGYPHVESLSGTTSAVLLPKPPLVDGSYDEYAGAVSGLWLTSKVDLAAFDVDLDFYVACAPSGNCADGLVVAWMDTTDPLDLQNGNTGNVAGLPASDTGSAVVVDDYQNSESGEPPAPAIHLIQLDPTKGQIGEYDWVKASHAASFLGAWHSLGIRVRGAAATVRLDGADLFSGTTKVAAQGLFGITAGTGGQTDLVGVKNVHASFYACTP